MSDFIQVHRWDNTKQSYSFVGTLYYNPELHNGCVYFCYDEKYKTDVGVSLDPKGLPVDKNQGQHVITYGDGYLPLFFQQFLPGEFAQSLLTQTYSNWPKLNQFERLRAISNQFGDQHAIQLDAHREQVNRPMTSVADVLKLAQSLSNSQPDTLPAIILPEHYITLASMPGHKPKLDFSPRGSTSRLVIKPQFTTRYNEAVMRKAIHILEVAAGIDSVETEVLSSSEFAVAAQRNYKHEHIPSDSDELGLQLKFNSISFDVLLSEQKKLSPSKMQSYQEAAKLLDRYSSNPLEDKEQLLKRAVFSAKTNHTNNGMENLALLDLSRNHWRLAPACNTLPNPDYSSTFELRFGEHLVSRRHFVVDKSFASDLAISFGLDGEVGISALFAIESAFQTFSNKIRTLLENNDFNTLMGIVGTTLNNPPSMRI